MREGLDVLFKTPHGSHLYGLAHEGSDRDYYVVVDKVPSARAKYAKQSIIGDEDTMVVDFGTWTMMCTNGVPQALEAMFSEQAIIDRLAPLRQMFVVSTGAYERYLRTITSFTMTQDNKRKRHGVRLALNMNSFAETGRFDPTLNPNEVDFITEYAKKDCDCVYAMSMNIVWCGAEYLHHNLIPRMIGA
jgi:hypothetical protein